MLGVFPQLKAYHIDYAWSGRVGFTFDRLPHLGCRDGVFYAAGYCGHGVALATYFGEKVYMEQLPFGTPRPKSEMSFRSPKEVQEFFTWMNEATGGSKYKSGSVDVNFDPYWYMFEYFIGGSGRFLGQGGKAIYDIGQTTVSAVSEGAKGQNVFDALNRMQEAPKPDMSLTRMPLARKVYGEAE